MSPFGLSAQRHWFMWDHARSRSRAGEVLLLPPPALPMILVKQPARGILTAPQQHNQCPGARLQQIQGAAPVQAERQRSTYPRVLGGHPPLGTLQMSLSARSAAWAAGNGVMSF